MAGRMGGSYGFIATGMETVPVNEYNKTRLFGVHMTA